MKKSLLLTLTLTLTAWAFSVQAQGLSLPPVDDPWWKSIDGEDAKTQLEATADLVRKGCDEFRDSQQTVDACYRAHTFVASGETLDLMSAEERHKFEVWFIRKKYCLNLFCDAAKLMPRTDTTQ